MKNKGIIIILLSLLFCFSHTDAQKTFSFEFHSDLLDETRTIRLHLPKSYTDKDTVNYPLLLSFDGEYLFYSIMGTSEVLSMRGIIPETIIVGIDQNAKDKEGYPQRWFDCDYDSKSGELKGKGIRFLSFINDELIPYINENYKTGVFYSIAGHSLTANYIHYFTEEEFFKGFIAISPYIPHSLNAKIENSFNSLSRSVYYFLCTGSEDLKGHYLQIREQDSSLFRPIQNENFNYLFNNYNAEDHMSLVTRSVVDALTFIYRGYAPIYTLNNDSLLLKNPDLISYLINRYKEMKEIYGIDIPIREVDLTSVAWLIEEQENWDELEEIANLTIEQSSNSAYGYYMLGLSQEKKNDLITALKSYKMGYSKLGNDVLNKEQFYEDIKRIEELLKKE